MFKFKKWDHIQLSAPKGSEDTAREFYANKLGFNEIENRNLYKVTVVFGLILMI